MLEHAESTVDDPRIEFHYSQIKPGQAYEEDGVKSEPSVIADTESADFETLHRTIREIFPNVVVSPALAVVTTDSWRYEEITDNTFHFIPTRMTQKDLKRPHGIDERISVGNYVEIIRFFVQQIRNSTG